ncbi:hypothetical protein [Amycolatopsis aidingensis]|uniref:hypothetical protein n=1 Tax=Amycolatopsis aidingensis TaxID=2842453 RepID=UPI001C0C68A6|nr:hypothetical protein [Amycolatopsis aidingensis]
MARTVLPNRPGSGGQDTDSVAELRDRTGILAASLPGRRRQPSAAEPEDSLLAQPYPADHPPADWFEPVSRPREIGRAGVVAWAAGALMFVVLVSGVYGTGYQRNTPADASDGRAQPTTSTPAPVAEIPPKPAPDSPEPRTSARTESTPRPVEPEPAPRREPAVAPETEAEAERPVLRSDARPPSTQPAEEPREEVRIRIPSLQDFIESHDLSEFTDFTEFGDTGSPQTTQLRTDQAELRIFPEAFLPR